MARSFPPVELKPLWRKSIDDHVISLAESPDGNTIAAAAIGGSIFLLNAADGAIRKKMTGHDFATSCLSWHPDGSRLASGGQDGKVRLWDSNNAECLKELPAGAAWVERVAFGPKGDFLVISAGRKLKLLAPDGELLRDFKDSPSTITDIQWSPKGDEFVTCAYGGVTFWNNTSTEAIRHFPWKGSLLALAWSPDGKMLAGGAQDASIHFWYLKNGRDLEMTGYPLKIRELSWNFQSNHLATGGGNVVTIWDCTGKGPEGTAPLSLEYHDEALVSLAYQHRGSKLLSGCKQGKLAVWDPVASKRPRAILNLQSGITHVMWAKTDDTIIAACEDGTVIAATLPT